MPLRLVLSGFPVWQTIRAAHRWKQDKILALFHSFLTGTKRWKYRESCWSFFLDQRL